MNKLIWPLMAALLFAGCATTNARTINKDIPPAPPGQAAVFGRVVLLNTVNRVSMPADNLDASIYFHDDSTDTSYKVNTIASGDFGVYLPPGTYKVLEIKTQGYKFVTDLVMTVPNDQRGVYTGTIILDGEPDGVIPGTLSSALSRAMKRLFLGTADTWFVYQVNDDQKEFEARLKKAAPDADVKFAKAVFTPAGGVAAGYYPSRRGMRTIGDKLEISSDVAEGIAGEILVTLPYYLNPLAFIGFIL